ncbi:hypothetical protein PIIN_09455 [Serendipita indica DSM 11827]|uniref:Uncharacterized protein n=1 Tax=Serendipita indica (strain DSM 11827) TaxID=1109443 RepID=G4TVX9_SERID|nr:hypothetical protein PIIN_09455 [Serendipita indica DSM 11827]
MRRAGFTRLGRVLIWLVTGRHEDDWSVSSFWVPWKVRASTGDALTVITSDTKFIRNGRVLNAEIAKGGSQFATANATIPRTISRMSDAEGAEQLIRAVEDGNNQLAEISRQDNQTLEASTEEERRARELDETELDRTRSLHASLSKHLDPRPQAET